MADLIGQVVHNQFRIDSFIASGGMGAVYRVWDMKRNVPLAMKVLHSELGEDPSMFKRFQREGRALQKLAHPNIVPFYGMYQTANFAFMLERYVDGPSLKDILRSNKGKPIPIDEALIYLKSLCAALGYAHANGVVHCDVKPGNVMIDHGGNIYLTDFGIARHAESSLTTYDVAGTPSYMSPEQILGQSVTPATDIYSLGVILYEMVTGQRPFRDAETLVEVGTATKGQRIRFAQLHLQPADPITLNPTLPKNLGDVILKTLAKQPSQRYSSTREFLLAVVNACNISLNNISERVIEKQSGKDLTSSNESTLEDYKHKTPVYSRSSKSSSNFTGCVASFFTSIFRVLGLILYGIYYIILLLPSRGVYSAYIFLKSRIRELHAQYLPVVQEEKGEERQSANNNLLGSNEYELIIPLNSAYDDIRREVFFGREKELNQFVQQLYSSRGGAFCLAGFRGVGKTRFLERSMDLLESRVEDSDGHILVKVWLSLPQPYLPKELMHIIIASLISRLKELGIINKLGRELENRLSTISKRLSKTIRSSKSKNVDVGFDLGSFIKTPNISIGEQDEEEFLPYEAPIAEREIISVLRNLSDLSIMHKFRKHKIRVVFVFDEMDKISDFVSLISMLRSLKTLFNESATSFIFVLGADQYKMMSTDENEELASKVDLYIPCLWDKTETVLGSIVKNRISQPENENNLLYRQFLNYLSFTCRGIPRRLWKTCDKYIFEENKQIFLGFSNKNIRQFKFYSELQFWLSRKMESYLFKKPDLSVLEFDLFKMSFYALADSILKSQGEWFTENDVVNAFNFNRKTPLHLGDDFISMFLRDLTKDEYLEKREDKYRLQYRRYVEMGEMRDDTMLTGDFRIRGSLTEDDFSNYTLDESKTEIIDFRDEHANSVNSKPWVLSIEVDDNNLIVRANGEYHAERTHVIKEDRIKDKCDIGRASGNDIELSDEESSRYHARLIYSPTGWQIIDMNTANGTFVDGFPISQTSILANDSMITIGKTNILFRMVK